MKKNVLFEKELFRIQTESGSMNLFALFIPLLLEQLFISGLGTVNTLVLSQVSEDAVAAVGAVTQIINTCNILSTIVSTGAAAVINNYLGATKLQEAKDASIVAIVLCTILGIMLGILMIIFRNSVISFMNLTGDIAGYARIYLVIRCTFFFISVATVMINTVMRCYGIAKTALYSGVTSNIVNLLGNVLAVRCFFANTFYLVMTIGFVCIFSQWCGLGVSIGHLRFRKISLKLSKDKKRVKNDIAKILKIGIPSGLATIGYSASQIITNAFAAKISSASLAAKIYFSNITTYCYLFSLSMANAVAVFVGRYSGALQYEKANCLCRQVILMTTCVNFLISSIMIFYNRSILSFFTIQEEIFKVAVPILALDMIAELARARSQVHERALAATGDSFFCVPFIIISGFINGVGMSYLLAIHMNLGLIGIWIGFITDEIVRMLITEYRWRTGKWREMSRLIQKK